MSTISKIGSGWKQAFLEDLVFLQRGFDITKDEQKPGNIPVVSSSGVNSYHSEAKAEGPGVVIGRKGSLGTVHYVEGPYWPHDTTLWSKDFRGNLPRYVFYFLHTLGLERYDVGNSNPTLNRNHIHRLKIQLPEYPIQERIVKILSAYDDLIENNRRRIQLLEQAARLLYREWFIHLRFPGYEHAKI
ncbi:MAG TPA: restriction endonuclease subunit S, partial [Syntrophales bacterium]|nr:restriction endonuclease subunit S [Syntrophales bacterium]